MNPQDTYREPYVAQWGGWLDDEAEIIGPLLWRGRKCARNGYLPDDDQFMSIHGGKHSKAWQRKAAEEMGVPWMRTIVEVCEAIPPAFTKFVGEQLATHLQAEGAVKS